MPGDTDHVADHERSAVRADVGDYANALVSEWKRAEVRKRCATTDDLVVEVAGRRSPEGSEFDIMSEEIIILSVKDRGSSYEIALDGGALTAFLSWVESRPSGRSVRGRRL